MASGTIVSRVLGFAKAILLVQAIGQTASYSADAFANGNALPNMIFYIVLGGLLQAVLVPQIVNARNNADGGAAYINKLLTMISTGMFFITAMAVAAAPFLTKMLALSWSDEQLALATAFAYWCLPQIFFYGLYTVLGEVLNAHNVFGPFTWAPVLNNVIAIAGLVTFIAVFGPDPQGQREIADWTALPIAVLAGSATLGIVAQALVLFLSWRKAGIRYRPDFRWRGMGLGKTARLAGWVLGTVLVSQIVTFVSTNIVNTATGEGPGQLAVQNAWLVFTLPHSVIAVSVATAYFTRLSEAGQTGDMETYRKEFLASTRVIMLLMLMATAILISCASYASQLMQVGATPEQVELFAYLIQAYALGLAPYSLIFVVNRCFFALSDTRTPFYINLALVVVEVLVMPVALLLPKTFTATGVALVASVMTMLMLIVALVWLDKKVGDMGTRRLLTAAARMLPATAVAAVAGLLLVELLAGWFPETHALLDIGFACVVAAAVALVYLGALSLLRAPEVAAARDAVMARLRRG